MNVYLKTVVARANENAAQDSGNKDLRHVILWIDGALFGEMLY